MSRKSSGKTSPGATGPKPSTAATSATQATPSVSTTPSSDPSKSDRKTGKVLWYNIEKKFGFIVPDEQEQKILYVDRAQIQAVSEEDSKQALQKHEHVAYKLNAEKLCAEEVTKKDGERVDFSKKIDVNQEGPRYIILNGAGPPPKPLEVLKVDETKTIKGRVMSWDDCDGWGFIQPEGPFRRIVVERSALQVTDYPALQCGMPVQFVVGTGPYPNSVTAKFIYMDDGEKINLPSPWKLRKSQKIDPIDDSVHKGTVVWFGAPPSQNFGFIRPADKEDSKKKEDQIFVHISSTNWIPLVENSKVEYKHGKSTEDKIVAVEVTGENGGPLEHNFNFPRPMMGPGQFWRGPPGPMNPRGVTYGGTANHQNSKKRRRNPQDAAKSPKPKVAKPKSSPEKFTCDVCDRTMVGKLQWESHCSGKVHKHKKEMADIESGCTVCSVTFSGKAHRDSHMKGKKHLQMVNPILFAAMYPDYEKKRMAYSNKNTFTRHWQVHRNALAQAGLIAPSSSSSHATIAPPATY